MMERLKKVARIILLCLLAVTSLNGLMVFLFFDGTNFITNQYFQWKKENEEDKVKNHNNHLKYLEKQIKDTRRNEKAKYQSREKLLEDKYRLLDTVIHGSHLIYRQPISGKYIENKLKSDHPFKIADEVLSICISKKCFYSENLPRYADLQFFKDKTAFQARRLGERRKNKPTASFPLKFSLVKKSGPFELWEAYWKVDDTLYEYYSNYMIHVNQKRVLRRDISIDRAGVFMGEASPSGKYLLLDHGCCPGVRGLSVIQENGKSILDTSYVGGADPIWKKDTLIFFNPIDEKSDTKDDCSKRGLPSYLSEKLFFIDGEIFKANERHVFCGQ